MASCERPDIGERLMMALSPADFAKEIPEIKEHLEQCQICRDELELLKRLGNTIRDHKDELAGAVSPCPSPDDLVELATGEKVDPVAELHVALCPECSEYSRLVDELSHEKLDWGNSSPSPKEKSLIRDMVAKEYGRPMEPYLSAIQNFFHTLRPLVQLPSLVMGAAAAALIFLLVLPEKPSELILTPALSNVVWAEPPTQGAKDVLLPKESPITRKKVALIILLPKGHHLPEKDVDAIYGSVDIAKRLGASYDFISPREVKQALGDPTGSADLAGIVDQVSNKTGADYVLAIEIFTSKSGDAVKGTLFWGSHKADRGSISQTGLVRSRIPSRITGIGAELLLEAEHT